MTPRVGLLGALLLVAIPAVASAQERNCRQVLPSDARRLMDARGREIIYFRDPVRVLCTGGLHLEADSAIMNRTTGSVQLVGRVVYRDSLRQLTADWANYIGGRDQLLARGSVVLRQLQDGSVVEGDELDYLRATETRPVTRMTVRGERPHAVIPPRPDSGPAADSGAVPDSGRAPVRAPGRTPGTEPDTAASTEVWSDRMEFVGEEVFRALGNVEIQRGEMTGASDSATFNQADERVTLMGRAHVRTDRYRLEGERIDAFLEGRELRSVLADARARLESDDLIVDADRIRIGFVDGRLDRLEAWNPAPASSPRALAVARDFRLRADSIDARSDSTGIREVRAVGRAYGEREVDSLAVGAPDAIARDWIQGDTILGYFEQRPAKGGAEAPEPARIAPDTVGPPAADPGVTPEADRDSTETVLRRIVVVGGGQPALSLYRMRPEDEESDTAINFMKARRIVLFLDQGDVTRVVAEGPLDGLYLSPAARDEGGGEASEETVPTEGRP